MESAGNNSWRLIACRLSWRPIHEVDGGPELALNRISVPLNLAPEARQQVITVSGKTIVERNKTWSILAAVSTAMLLIVVAGGIDIVIFDIRIFSLIAMSIIRCWKIRDISIFGESVQPHPAHFANREVGHHICASTVPMAADELTVLKLITIAAWRELSLHAEMAPEVAVCCIVSAEIRRVWANDGKRHQTIRRVRGHSFEPLLTVEKPECLVADHPILMQSELFLNRGDGHDVVARGLA
jgi:hypothetical protein